MIVRIAVFSFFFFISSANTYRILLINPFLGQSHVNFVAAIGDAIVEDGHVVHMIEVEFNPSVKAAKSKAQKVSQISGSNMLQIIRIQRKRPNPIGDIEFVKNPFRPNQAYDSEQHIQWDTAMNNHCADILDDLPLLKSLFENETYDIGMSESFGSSGFMLLHLARVKTSVLLSACPLFPFTASAFGIPQPASFVGNPMMDRFTLNAPHFSYWERVVNLFFGVFYGEVFFKNRATAETELYRRAIGKEVPNLWDEMRKSTLIFDNTHPLLDLAKPTAHKVVHIGGIAVEPGPQLDNKTKAILDSSVNGTILVSFGTFASTEVITGDILLQFLAAFAAFPSYDFIWKLDVKNNDSAILTHYPNVHPFKFTPQQGILAHPKTKAFVSHMGMNSFIEASSNGVPLVAIPLFGDQFYNAAVARERGTAVFLDKLNVTTPNLIWALEQILCTPSYQKSAQALKRQLELYPSNARKQLLDFVNYLGEFGPVRHFDLAGSEISTFVYYSLDIFIPLSILGMILTFVTFKISLIIVKSIIKMLSKLSTKSKLD